MSTPKFTVRMVVSSVDAELRDLSQEWDDGLGWVLGRTSVSLVGGPLRLTIVDWRNDRPRVGDEFDLTVEAVS